ncbi:hypothetical protein BGZ51_003345 [Haplosporangium sp. Z 767]|nr:hypothetical protein BGZ51_003345 [Haplosporangium sp. Z 767]
MGSHTKKEASAKNPSSHVNLPEAAPRKSISLEGFHRPSLASNTSSSSGVSSSSGNPLASGAHPRTAAASSTDRTAATNSSGTNGVSTFSYLKARLFGSVADASTSFTSSARDLLQSKKNADGTKGLFESTSKTSSGRAPAEPASPSLSDRVRHGDVSTHVGQSTDNYTHHYRTVTGGLDITTTASPIVSTTSTTPTQQQQQQQQHRFFSRTLPNRRQPQPQPQMQSDPLLLTQGKPVSLVDPDPRSTSELRSPVPATSPTTLSIPSPISTSRQAGQNQRCISTGSLSKSQKHLSTSSILYHEGFLNKKVELHAGETGHGWKVYRVMLKSSKVYFYKPLAAEERPKFQDPKDHQRHHPSAVQVHGGQPYHHHQHSSYNSFVSPRLSITNECGMVLSASKFESSTRTLLFEGNAMSLGPGMPALAPPISKYVYGECFTEIDRMTMQFKKHVALLLFEDSVVICKRKWIRYTATKVKDAIKFSSNSTHSHSRSHDKSDMQETGSGKHQHSLSGISNKPADSRGSESEPRARSSFDRPTEKQRGYFTKWKHEATYPLSQVEALDMASPVPSSSATFYPFAAPAPATVGSLSAVGRNPRGTDMPPSYASATMPTYNHQTTSTLELIITNNIDGTEYTHRLLFLPPSQEVRHHWYSKFNRAKELYDTQSRVPSNGRESVVFKDTLSPRPIHSNNSAPSLASPSSPILYNDASKFVLNGRKMERARLYCETTVHPGLTLQPDEASGADKLVAASINGLLHELVFGNVTGTNTEVITVFATTYPLFTTARHVLREVKRCVSLLPDTATKDTIDQVAHRVEILIQQMVEGFNAKTEQKDTLDELRLFTKDVLQDTLKSTAATDILKRIDSILQVFSPSPSVSIGESSAQTLQPIETTVDLSNVLITGLTPALFLKLDASYFAEQVLRYHVDQLDGAGGFEAILRNPAFFMRQFPTAGSKQHRQSSLVFSMYSPHFLTVLITHHILIATQSVQSTSRRPKLLVQWIRTAQHSRNIGDMAGFMAIAIGICSPGVIRLQETWKHVPLDLRKEVAETWVPLLIKIDMVTEDMQELAISCFHLTPTLNTLVDLSISGANVIVPCVCNVKQSVDQLDRTIPSFIPSTPAPLLNIEKLEQLHSILLKAKSSIPMEFLSRPREEFSSNTNGHLQQYFGHLASISQTLHDQYHSNELSNDAFESSLACESYFSGQYLDYHYKNRKMTGSFIPLMFPEVTSVYRLFSLQLLLSLENTGGINRKRSFDETHPLQAIASRESQLKHLSGYNPYGSAANWADSSATHHGATHPGLGNESNQAKPLKRTYSFPPARTAARLSGVANMQQIINMINPHLDTAAREYFHHIDESEQNKVILAMQRVAGIGYSTIAIECDQLILKVKDESLEALVKTVILEDGESQSAAGNKRSSVLRNAASSQGPDRSSLSLLSGARSAMVKAGSLEMLIHVLVMGLEDQSGKYMDEKGDMIPWTSRQLVLDHASFKLSFFATFRSFCTAGRLLDQLVIMFTFAEKSQIRDSRMPAGLDLFLGPRMTFSGASMHSNNRDSLAFHWKRILALQLNVLRTLEYWLKMYFSDFSNDLALKAKLAGALRAMSDQVESQRLLMGDQFGTDEQAVSGQLIEVKKLAVQQSMRPIDATYLGSEILETFLGTPPSVEQQLDDSWSVDQILDQLNTAALAHFLSVRDQEWFILFHVLESQSADPMGWFLSRTYSVIADEDIIITDIHNTLTSIRRNGALGTHWNGERLISALPMCLQNMCRLHHVIRGWVVSQVASPNIAFDVRVSRIQKMLDVILRSRAKMSQFGRDVQSSPMRMETGQQSASRGGGVPSFVESAIESALISPESRAYTRAWQEVASRRKGSVDSLEDMLAGHVDREPSSIASDTAVAQEMVPAIGWLVERMLEACCYVRDMSYESPSLVNFDKRQYVYDLVQVFIHCQKQLRDPKAASTPLTAWLGLSAGPGLSLSMKSVREASQREITSQRNASTGQLSSTHGSHPGRSSRPISNKIFSHLVAMQQEKMRRDQKEFEKLDRQINEMQDRVQKAQQEQAKTLEKQIKLEQSRSRVKNQLLKSTLMRAMRPISLAITNSWSSATTTVSNATALGSAISGKVMGGTAVGGTGEAATTSYHHAFESPVSLQFQARSTSLSTVTSPKPAHVINLINATCSVAYTYTKRDFVFKIVTEEGGQTLLQALDYDDMLRWIKVMNDAAADATAKRRTLLDNDESLKNAQETAAQVDEIPVMAENERKGRNSVFGVELRHLMCDGNVPLIVEKCIAEIEKRGLEEVGIYRVPGAISSINKLRLSFNSGSHNVDLDGDEWKDINVVAGALKQFLRELPEAVMTSALYDSLITASALEDYDERLMTMKDLIRTLPAPNYILLKRIIEHLERVTDYEEINHMYATNLAIVFGPTLLRPGGTSANSFATSMKNLGHQQNIVRNMILQYHWLFDVEEEGGEDDGGTADAGVDNSISSQLADQGMGDDDDDDDDDDDEGLGEFPEISEDSDGDDYETEDREAEEDKVVVLTATPVVSPLPVDRKEVDKETHRTAKHQRRKTIVFG